MKSVMPQFAGAFLESFSCELTLFYPQADRIQRIANLITINHIVSTIREIIQSCYAILFKRVHA
jgi:hypothetical protein